MCNGINQQHEYGISCTFNFFFFPPFLSFFLPLLMGCHENFKPILMEA
jgi:hypothetical protein